MTIRRNTLDRRLFLGGMAALGASPLVRPAFAADDAFNIGWVRPTTGRQRTASKCPMRLRPLPSTRFTS